MRIAMGVRHSASVGFRAQVDRIREYEAAGLDVVHVAELYGFDAVSQLGYLAARTERVQIASGVLQLYSRTPSLMAMTAAGLDYVSEGRFTLGIGVSGPQVIEGFHGVPYDSPLGTTRETVEICRKVWRREALQYDGKQFRVPLPDGQGTGLGKPLKLINHPVRERIPVVLAALGPRNVALAAEIAEGWQPTIFMPDRADLVWGESLRKGAAARDPQLGPLDVHAGAALAIGDDVDELLDLQRPNLALYIGGMGARNRNFYNDLVRRYGFEKEAELIQDLYLSGRRAEAEAAVPVELLRATSLIGSRSYVAERLEVYRAAGVGTLSVRPVAADPARQFTDFSTLRELIG